MRVGFVRNVGLAALGLAVAVTAACNDDPLSFDNNTTFDIVANPSAMTVPAGVDVQLATRAVNQGGEATWAEVTHVVAPACVTLEDDPARTDIQPPGLFLVRGGATIGSCEITLTAGGVNTTVPVTNVAGAIVITEFQEVVAFGSDVQFQAAVYTLDEPPLLMGPFENSDAVWTSSDAGVATVDESGLVTGAGAGDAAIQACWSTVDAEGYEICDEVSISVEVVAPTVTGLLPGGGASFTEVTVQGTGFVSAHQLYIGGILPGNNYTLTITSITDTELKFIWPALASGPHDVIVGVAPDAVSGSVSFDQTAGIEAEPFEPENDDPGTTPIAIDAGGYYIGGTGNDGADQIDYVEVTVAVDGDYSPVLFWDSGQDMDFALYDSGLTEICHSWYSNPEDECGSVTLSAGTYYAEMYDFSGALFDTTYRFEMFDDN